MNILVTGSTGFLGAILKESLIFKGHNVFELLSEDGTMIDITAPFSVQYSDNLDLIIHCAGKAHGRGDFVGVNFHGTKNLFSSLHIQETKTPIIFMSSVSVYGRVSGELYDEKAPLKGKTPYAYSKMLAEDFLQEMSLIHDFSLCILRVPLLFGPFPKGNLKAMIDGLASKRYLSIGHREARKSVLWAEDIVSILNSLIRNPGVYNLTDGCHPSIGELEEKFCMLLHRNRPKNISMRTASVLAKLGDLLGGHAAINSEKLNILTSTLTFDDSRARETLGWAPNPVINFLDKIIRY